MPCVMSIIRDRDIALVFRRRAARPARCASGSWFIITLSLCTVQMLRACGGRSGIRAHWSRLSRSEIPFSVSHGISHRLPFSHDIHVIV